MKLLALLVVVGAVAQGGMYGSAWMDDNRFGTSILQTLGDNMTAKQMEKDILTLAQQQKVPVKPEQIKVTIDCGEGAGRAPSTVTSRLGSAISVTKSCTVTGTADYTRKVGLMSKPVHLVRTKNFAAGATVSIPGGSSGVQMPSNIPRDVPSADRLKGID